MEHDRIGCGYTQRVVSDTNARPPVYGAAHDKGIAEVIPYEEAKSDCMF